MNERAPRRIRLTGAVQVALSNGRALKGDVVDLSTAGLTLLSRTELAPGVLVELTFKAPTPGGPVPITCLSEVSGCLFFCGSRGYLVSTRFLNMSDGSRQRVRRLVYGPQSAYRRDRTVSGPSPTGTRERGRTRTPYPAPSGK